MKEPILKAVARQPTLFGAPLFPALLNFELEMALMIMITGIFPGKVSPLIFVFNQIIGHIILIAIGAKEPCFGKIVQSVGPIKSNWKPDGKLNKANLTFVQKNIPANTDHYSNFIQTADGTLTAVTQFNVPSATAPEDSAILWNNLFLTCQDNALPMRIFQDNYHDNSYLIISAPKGNAKELNQSLFNCIKALEAFGAVILSDMEAEHIFQDLIQGDITFDKETDIFRLDNGRQYGAYVGITHLGNDIDTQMLTDILALRYQIKIQHNIIPVPSLKANVLLIQQRKMAFFTTFSQNVYNQYTTALETVSAGQQLLTCYALNFFVSGNTADEVEQGIKEIISVLSYYHFTAQKERQVARETFLTQFPTFNIYPRERLFLSGAVATALSVPNNQNTTTQWGTRW